MIVEIYRISELNCPKVCFYSVKLGNNTNTEYKDFVLKMSALGQDRIDLGELQKYIKETIGHNQYGAEKKYFKREDYADRIRQPTPDTYDPTKPDPKDYGLRNFCLLLSDKIVILFNGDRKTYLEVNDCPKCKPHFEMANRISKAIDEAIHRKNIILDGFDISIEPDDFELKI